MWRKRQRAIGGDSEVFAYFAELRTALRVFPGVQRCARFLQNLPPRIPCPARGAQFLRANANDSKVYQHAP